MEFHSSSGSKPFKWDFYIAPITDPILLGLDFLKATRSQIDLDKNTLTVRGEVMPILIGNSKDHSTQEVCQVTLLKKVSIPPNSTSICKVKFNGSNNKDFILEPIEHDRALIPSVLISPEYTPIVEVANFTKKHITLHAGTVIGDAVEIYAVLEDDSPRIRQTTWEEKILSKPDPDKRLEKLLQQVDKHLSEIHTDFVRGKGQGLQQVISEIPEHVRDLFDNFKLK